MMISRASEEVDLATEWVTKSPVLWFMATGAKTQDQTSAAQFIDGVGDLGD